MHFWQQLHLHETTHSYSHPPSISWATPSMPNLISIPTLNAVAPRKLRQLWAALQRQEQMPVEGQHLLNRLYVRSDSFKKELIHGIETIRTFYSWGPLVTELKRDLPFLHQQNATVQILASFLSTFFKGFSLTTETIQQILLSSRMR